MFLNSSVLAPEYNRFFGALWKSKINAAIRELLMLRVAALNYATFEWIAHEPMGRAAGLTDDQLRAIRDVSYLRPVKEKRPSPSPALTPLMIAATEYADAMTLDVKVPQEVFDALKAHLDNQEMFEATAIVSGYNMITRIILATDVGDLANTEVPQVKSKNKL
ncbi:hypothetical protein M422DRAFT_71841 [Sphaerobolus stellatus SS14]|uniref:Carboxymuconolactone decarboxylase-like domain-containing protein n=1 Tax=Sphaerobolus stellatus (strain SS14) TaxID=990650 RepID=A0A0C9TC30_SPHS4|nr:hypothetical protein M422DRAFT_71841 [Sphaerobolus stellatus SS14]